MSIQHIPYKSPLKKIVLLERPFAKECLILERRKMFSAAESQAVPALPDSDWMLIGCRCPYEI